MGRELAQTYASAREVFEEVDAALSQNLSQIMWEGPKETLTLTGHPVGGVCPFGLAMPLPVYLDVSLQAFESVYPAAGSRTSSLEVIPGRLFELVATRWVDLCTLPESQVPE